MSEPCETISNNLFSALLATPLTDQKSLPTEHVEPVIEEEPHPAQDLQKAYEDTITGVEGFNRHVAAFLGMCNRISFRPDVDELSDRYAWAIHSAIIDKTVKRFKASCMTESAAISAREEYTEIFGTEKCEFAYEHRTAKFTLTEEAFKAFRVDVIGLWDGLAARYADGGVRLARTQAANEIFEKFNLRRETFKVINGKAQLSFHVWAEKKFNSKEYEYSYNSQRYINSIRKPLKVFIEYAGLTDAVDAAFAEAMGNRYPSTGYSSSMSVQSGKRCTPCPGHIEFKTFLKEMKWSFSELAANKLREFLAEYATCLH